MINKGQKEAFSGEKSDDEVKEDNPCEKNLVATSHLGNAHVTTGMVKNYIIENIHIVINDNQSLFDTV